MPSTFWGRMRAQCTAQAAPCTPSAKIVYFGTPIVSRAAVKHSAEFCTRGSEARSVNAESPKVFESRAPRAYGHPACLPPYHHESEHP